jgi:hypothetical protein
MYQCNNFEHFEIATHSNLSGKLTVPHKYDLLKSGTIRLTVKSPGFKDPLCLLGVSQYIAMPTKFWSVFSLFISVLAFLPFPFPGHT